MYLGAHVSAAGKLCHASEKARALGCNCMQIFVGSPMMWQKPHYSIQETELFKSKNKEYGIGPVFIHALYLVNLASSNNTLWKRSIAFIVHSMEMGGRMGARGVIVHPGSFGETSREQGIRRIILAVRSIFMMTKVEIPLLLETTAGMGNSLASSLEDLQEIYQRLNKPKRLKICLDTAHLFEAGYDLSSKEGANRTLHDLRKTGLGRLALAIHVNDSKTPCGSKVDRHENIGQGQIGLGGIKYFLQNKMFKDASLILETPGFDQKGPDLKNMAILRKLLKKNFPAHTGKL